jgi:DNA invertase Pin-like site-specific DNA recombinase
MSSSPQEKSIPQQHTETAPRAQQAGIDIVREFRDEGISGGGMKKRDAFLEMLRFCETQAQQGTPVNVVVCYDTSRFSRATSMETAHYIWSFQKALVHRVFTCERWFDFRKEEDRAIFLLQQDFTNNRYLRDHSARVLRGLKATVAAGFWAGGPVPYAFDRLLFDEKGEPVGRVARGEKLAYRAKGSKTLPVPIPADDPDAARQLERQTIAWLFEQFDERHVSSRALAADLNDRAVPPPGRPRRARRPDTQPQAAPRWTPDTVENLLASPLYAGLYRWGHLARGKHHRFVAGEICPQLEQDSPPTVNVNGVLHVKLEEGIVPQDRWERVQRKLAQRKGGRPVCRCDGYLLTGLVRCGHCRSRMQGERRPRGAGARGPGQAYYYCVGYRRRPGSCRPYAIQERKLLGALARKLQQVYLAPERLEGLRARLREKLQSGRRGGPEEPAMLRQRLADLDAEIEQGRRNLFRAGDDATFGALKEEMQACLARRARLAEELAAATRRQETPAAELAAKVNAAVARLSALREELAGVDPSRLGEVLRRLVVGIDVYFEAEQHGRRPWYVFRKGVVKLRPGLEAHTGLAVNDPAFSARCRGRAADRPRS